ncbi:MAG: hypothetical protein EPO23_03410 [Xanthobacteraceae bacterium]|nr:MAG: hypothetical protein EPO23_03410 [Xanthobacteraceae bacterium]
MRFADWLIINKTSNADMAARLDVSAETVRRWRTGERFPDAATQKLIFDLTNGAVTPNDWVGVGHQPAGEGGRDLSERASSDLETGRASS